MKGKERNNRRGLLMLIMIASLAVFITTATYAWFTANRTVTISPIQVNVEATGGVQISVDGTSWRSIVTVDDIMNAHDEYGDSINQVPTILEPVSSGWVVDTGGLMEMFYGIVETNGLGHYILTTTKSTETRGDEGHFVAFDLFFRVDDAETLYLTGNSNVETPDATDTGIKNAARAAFINLGNVPIGSSIPDIQAINAGVAAPVYVWEPNYNSHTAPAIAHAWDVYGIDANTTDPISYSGVIAEIDAVDDVLVGEAWEVDYPLFFADVDPHYKTEDGFTDAIETFSLAAGISKVRIYMWIEGQDIDTENSASGGNAIFNVQFTIDAP